MVVIVRFLTRYNILREKESFVREGRQSRMLVK